VKCAERRSTNSGFQKSNLKREKSPVGGYYRRGMRKRSSRKAEWFTRRQKRSSCGEKPISAKRTQNQRNV